MVCFCLVMLQFNWFECWRHFSWTQCSWYCLLFYVLLFIQIYWSI